MFQEVPLSRWRWGWEFRRKGCLSLHSKGKIKKRRRKNPKPTKQNKQLRSQAFPLCANSSSILSSIKGKIRCSLNLFQLPKKKKKKPHAYKYLYTWWPQIKYSYHLTVTGDQQIMGCSNTDDSVDAVYKLWLSWFLLLVSFSQKKKVTILMWVNVALWWNKGLALKHVRMQARASPTERQTVREPALERLACQSMHSSPKGVHMFRKRKKLWTKQKFSVRESWPWSQQFVTLEMQRQTTHLQLVDPNQ